MTRFTATRRRLLAGLAILGLPVAAWAQDAASDIEGYEISCQRSGTVNGAFRQYDTQYDVVGGRFVLKGDGHAAISLQSSGATLAPGVTQSASAVLTRATGTAPGQTETRIRLTMAIAARSGDAASLPLSLEIWQGKKSLWKGQAEIKPEVDSRTVAIDQIIPGPQASLIKGKLRVVLRLGSKQMAEYAFDATKLTSPIAYRDATHRTIAGKPYAEAALPQGCTKKTPSSGCFVTTAAVETIGLADDCWELQTLRHFRDTALPAMPGGATLIRDYYALAPGMIARINRRPDARRIWLNTYWTGVIPSAVCAAVGWNRGAMVWYARALKRLARLAV